MTRFRGRTARWVALTLYAVGLATVPLAVLPQWEDPDARGVIATALAAALVAGVILVRPRLVSVRLGSLVAAGLVTAMVLSTGGVDSPWHPLLALQLFFGAVILPVRTLAPVLVAYVAIRVGLLVASGDARDLTPVAVDAAVDLTLTALVAAWAAAMADAAKVDRLRAAVNEAGSTAAVSRAFESLLGGDVVAGCLVVVDGTPVTLAETVADVGLGALPLGETFRVVPDDAFARVVSTGPLQTRPDPTSADRGERVAAARGYGSLATFPLQTREGLVGYVVLCSDRPDAFPPHRLRRLGRRLSPLASPVASFLVRRERDARLRAALAGRLLSVDLAEARTPERVATLAAERTAELLGAPDVAMLLTDRSEHHVLRTVAAVGGYRSGEVVDTQSRPSPVHAAMARRTAVWIPDVSTSSVVDPEASARMGTEASLAVPLLGPGGARGGLSVAWRSPKIMRSDEIDLAMALGAEIGAALTRLEVDERLRAQATRDPLTGLLNHAAFHEQVERALAGIGRDRGPVALVLADLDHLKHLNDFHGHGVGDAALRAVADVLASEARATDAVGRLGGDEFGWLLVGSSPDDAIAAAERAIRLVAGRTVEPAGTLSLSAGVSVTASTIEPATLFERADRALYDAKARGRGVALLAHRRPGLPASAADGVPHDAPPPSTDPAAADTLEDAAAAVAAEWTALFRASGCTVSLLDDDGAVLVEIASSLHGEANGASVGTRWVVAEFPATAEVLRTRSVVTARVDDPQSDPAEVAVLRRIQQGSVLVVPLSRRGRVQGIIEVYDARPRAFTGDEQRLALGLAGYVAAVLDRFSPRTRPGDDVDHGNGDRSLER